MITGSNTDVPHNKRVFHVQTEDKGTSNPYVESLIYVGGMVLAAKRTEYGALLAEGKGDEAVLDIMDRQHRSMISEIREGKYDQKVVDLFGESQPEKLPQADGLDAALDDEAVEAERSLDEVILEYLTHEAQQEHLVLMLEGDVELSYGQRASLTIRAAASRSGRPMSGALVTSRMISTVSEPMVLGEGMTDDEGMLSFEIDIPDLAQGSSALIIQAESSLGRAELKYLL